MKNFEFKSAVCTSVEQSKRLLALGLKKETADMYHNLSTGIIEVPYTEVELKRELERNDVIPAWSLHRLIELYSDVEDTSSLSIKDISYKLLIFCIEKAIHCGLFNQDYLEEKK